MQGKKLMLKGCHLNFWPTR